MVYEQRGGSHSARLTSIKTQLANLAQKSEALHNASKLRDVSLSRSWLHPDHLDTDPPRSRSAAISSDLAVFLLGRRATLSREIDRRLPCNHNPSVSLSDYSTDISSCFSGFLADPARNRRAVRGTMLPFINARASAPPAGENTAYTGAHSRSSLCCIIFGKLTVLQHSFLSPTGSAPGLMNVCHSAFSARLATTLS